MSTTNVFEEDWRDCLRAHYFHVIRERDTNNEQSLITVLHQTGFTDQDIAAFRQEVLHELGWIEPETTDIGESPAAELSFENAVSETSTAELPAAESEIVESDSAVSIVQEQNPLAVEETAASVTETPMEPPVVGQDRHDRPIPSASVIGSPMELPSEPESKPVEPREPLLEPSKKPKKPPKQMSLF